MTDSDLSDIEKIVRDFQAAQSEMSAVIRRHGGDLLASAVERAGGVRKLARSLGLSSGYISRLSTGDYDMTYQFFIRLAGWLVLNQPAARKSGDT
jgi:transcriptional regulator with XRE-family HTH domain